MHTVKLPDATHVNLYAETGITVGVRLKVVNITPNDVSLYSTLDEPVKDDVVLPLLFGRGSAFNDVNDAGAWAKCVGGGAINVKILP